MRGEMLGQGRFRLIEPVLLPKNQHGQGAAWFASDMRSARQRVVVRKIEFPIDFQGNTQQTAYDIAIRFEQLSSSPGFPAFIDLLQEQGSYYLVLKHPAGETLAALITEQGGALAERDVAEYGQQLCAALSALANQQPPLVHGGISPHTIIVNSEANHVFLTLLPLFPPQPLLKDDTTPDYFAPEQVRGSTLPSSDLYALAATLHHAVTGYDPQERLAFFYPPARRLNPTVTREMEAILARQLYLSVPQRYPGPADMQQDFAALIDSYQSTIVEPAYDELQPYPQSPLTSKNNKSAIIIIIFCLLLLFLLLAAVPVFFKPPHASESATATSVAQHTLLNTEMQQEMQMFQQQGIGISDGQLIFDTYASRTDVQLKKQAAQALQQGNTSLAMSLFNQALAADPIDGEAQIYAENLRVLQESAPYVTIVVGLPIANSDVYLGSDRATLQAIYLAQQEANTQNLLPHNLKLRILIANSGSNNADVATVAQFINNRVNQDGNLDHIIGVVGWPYSSQTVNAIQSIVGADLPLVAATASSVKLSGISPYFFRVCPADDVQGAALGTLMVNQMGAKKILILHDPTNSDSVSLANAVANQVTALGAAITQATFTEQTTTVNQYQQLVEQATTNNVDTIFMAGSNMDGIRLAHAVGNKTRANPDNTQLSQLKLVGGDTMEVGDVLLGDGTSADANLAYTFPQDMRRLVLTSFADANEWNLLNVPSAQQPSFFSAWKSTYQGSQVHNNAPNPTYEGILGYDATKIILYAITTIHDGPITGDAMRNALASIGKGPIPAYQGVSGRIAFNNKGDPINKAVVVLAIQDNGGGNQFVVQQVVGTFR
jgi:eukaryotic-like serine/threonine-protein kinase